MGCNGLEHPITFLFLFLAPGPLFSSSSIFACEMRMTKSMQTSPLSLITHNGNS